MLKIQFPVLVKTVSSPFGPRNGKFHNGVDFPCPAFSDVFIFLACFVAYVNYDADGYGHYVILEFPSLGITMLLAHLQPSHGLYPGQRIQTGAVLKGITGNSGTSSSGAHLHVEIRLCKYGRNFWLDDPDIPYKKLYTVDPMWFFHDFLADAKSIWKEKLDEPQNWESFDQALAILSDPEIQRALKVVERMGKWFQQYTKDIYN